MQAFVFEQIVSTFSGQGLGFAFQAGRQRLDCGGRAGGHTTQQGQRGVPNEAGTARLGLFHRLCHLAAIRLHSIEKSTPIAGELVRELGFHAAGKASAILRVRLPFDDVFATALHKVAGKLVAQGIICGCEVLQAQKRGVEQGKQVVKRDLVA